ncbi:hypothetical protein KAR91_61830 [Candidatus Pacearchaeota archaeon]|nr:hypothetical protein [Candidatus Pacearchaeota archaeon]
MADGGLAVPNPTTECSRHNSGSPDNIAVSQFYMNEHGEHSFSPSGGNVVN